MPKGENKKSRRFIETLVDWFFVV